MTSAPHLDDVALAALFDGALPESEAVSARAHLEGCTDCKSRFDQTAQAAQRLTQQPEPQPEIAVRVMEQIEAGPRRGWLDALGPFGWSGVGALAGAAVVLVVVGTLADPPEADAPHADVASAAGVSGIDGAPVARGGPPEASSGVELVAHVRERTRLVPVGLDGASAKSCSERPSVQTHVDVLAPAPEARFMAIYARDELDQVTWLHPVWPATASTSPVTLPVPSKVGRVGQEGLVELVAPAKVVEVALVLLTEQASIAQLDAELERGDHLQPGVRSVIDVQRRFFRYRPIDCGQAPQGPEQVGRPAQADAYRHSEGPEKR